MCQKIFPHAHVQISCAHVRAHAKCTFSRVIRILPCKTCMFSVCHLCPKMHMRTCARVPHVSEGRARAHAHVCQKIFPHAHVQISCAHVRTCKMHVFTCNSHYFMQKVHFQRVPIWPKNAHAHMRTCATRVTSVAACTCARVPKKFSHVTRANLMCTRAHMQNARFHV